MFYLFFYLNSYFFVIFQEEEEEDEEEEELEEDATDRIRNEINDIYDNDTNKLAAVTVSIQHYFSLSHMWSHSDASAADNI